jgi:thiosulfate reductase cytochrome b subunit
VISSPRTIHGTLPTAAAAQSRIIHPWWLRMTHWINALAVFIMLTSGWRIYDASPVFSFRIPPSLTLGGWLGGALQWHFAAMWLLVVNGLLYIVASLATGRLWRQLLPIRLRQLAADLRAALKGNLAHDDIRHYNAVQKLAYWFVIADTVLIVASGLVLWKSVQFPLLRELMGGYNSARKVHFYAMSGLLGFIFIHLALVIIVPRTLLAMIRGR